MNRRKFLSIALGACGAGILASGCGRNFANTDAYLTVEESLCIGCGDCEKVCKGAAITIADSKASIDPANCVRCGNCVKVCPYNAIN